MGTPREHSHQELLAFLKTIHKPNKQIEAAGLDDSLVAGGYIDSLAIVQIVLHLEKNHGIDFSANGLDPERLGTIGGILDLIEETRK